MDPVRKHFAPALRRTPWDRRGGTRERSTRGHRPRFDRERARPGIALLGNRLDNQSLHRTAAGRHVDSGRGRLERSHRPPPSRSGGAAVAFPALQPTLTDLATHASGLPRLPVSIIRKVKGGVRPVFHADRRRRVRLSRAEDKTPPATPISLLQLRHGAARPPVGANRRAALLDSDRGTAPGPVGHDRHPDWELWRSNHHRAGLPQGETHSPLDLWGSRGGRWFAIHRQRPHHVCSRLYRPARRECRRSPPTRPPDFPPQPGALRQQRPRLDASHLRQGKAEDRYNLAQRRYLRGVEFPGRRRVRSGGRLLRKRRAGATSFARRPIVVVFDSLDANKQP